MRVVAYHKRDKTKVHLIAHRQCTEGVPVRNVSHVSTPLRGARCKTKKNHARRNAQLKALLTCLNTHIQWNTEVLRKSKPLKRCRPWGGARWVFDHQSSMSSESEWTFAEKVLFKTSARAKRKTLMKMGKVTRAKYVCGYAAKERVFKRLICPPKQIVRGHYARRIASGRDIVWYKVQSVEKTCSRKQTVAPTLSWRVWK